MTSLWRVTCNKLAPALGVAAFLTLGAPPPARAAVEQSFDVLRIGTRSYTNVTVTTKAKDYVFLLHSTGMANVKVADMPDDVRLLLGYGPDKQKSSTNSSLAWAKQTLTKVHSEELKQVEERLSKTLGLPAGAMDPTRVRLNPALLAGLAAAALLSYVFFCYCWMLICRKAGKPGGVLLWIPVLQLIPLLRAAGMSRLWFLAFFVPLLNLVAHILWSFKIVQARGKNLIFTVLLLLPVTNLFSILYLAFSEDESARREERRPIQIMTLETA